MDMTISAGYRRRVRRDLRARQRRRQLPQLRAVDEDADRLTAAGWGTGAGVSYRRANRLEQGMPKDIGGVPTHPLIVHIPVVMVPLALVAVIAYFFAPPWRRPLAWVAGVLAAGGAFGAVLAVSSGEDLRARAQESRALADHAEMGYTDRLLAFIFFVFVAALGRVPGGRGTRMPRRSRGRGGRHVVDTCCASADVPSDCPAVAGQRCCGGDESGDGWARGGQGDVAEHRSRAVTTSCPRNWIVSAACSLVVGVCGK